MIFRKATSDDIDTILSIVRSAQLSLCASGVDQWQDGYPSAEIIRSDIDSGNGYVIEADGGGIAAYGAVISDTEAAYDLLQNGEWHHEGDYIVIHRLCVAAEWLRRGMAKAFFRYAMQSGRRRSIGIIRVDTHSDNRRMLSLLDSEGFAYCGKVYYRGAERLAFDRRIDPPAIATRRATVDDCDFIARAVMAAFGDDLCRRLCNGADRRDILDTFTHIISRPDTQYSYRNTLVATIDGIVVGAVCGYDGGRLDELRRPVFALLRERFTEVPLFEEDETQAGEFYLDSIGVDPLYRGCGVGERLLRDMTAMAKSEGADTVALLVDRDNPSAERLYTRVGFRRDGSKRFLGHTMYHLTI
ncbi:MAG: GNAT family N-acetyltransferase [Alistipes sp.]|nr:GNAT family N-acetyltransferase [Alistipes sp.]